MNTLPSPSGMSVADIKKILHGSIPKCNCAKVSIEEVTSNSEMELVRSKVEKILDATNYAELFYT